MSAIKQSKEHRELKVPGAPSGTAVQPVFPTLKCRTNGLFFKQKWTWTVCFFGHSASPESQVLVTNTSEEVLARHVVLAGLPPRQILGIQFEPNLPEEVVQLLHGLRPDPGFRIVVSLAKAASELASN